MFDCSGVMFVTLFLKKAKISKWPKKPGNRTNMDITLSFLAKSLDKHGITQVHITYPPLGLRPKWKELLNYMPENQIDILALNETILKPKFKFHLPGYDIYKNDRLVGTKGGVAILVKKRRHCKPRMEKWTFQCHNRQRGSCNRNWTSKRG